MYFTFDESWGPQFLRLLRNKTLATYTVYILFLELRNSPDLLTSEQRRSPRPFQGIANGFVCFSSNCSHDELQRLL